MSVATIYANYKVCNRYFNKKDVGPNKLLLPTAFSKTFKTSNCDTMENYEDRQIKLETFQQQHLEKHVETPEIILHQPHTSLSAVTAEPYNHDVQIGNPHEEIQPQSPIVADET